MFAAVFMATQPISNGPRERNLFIGSGRNKKKNNKKHNSKIAETVDGTFKRLIILIFSFLFWFARWKVFFFLHHDICADDDDLMTNCERSLAELEIYIV